MHFPVGKQSNELIRIFEILIYANSLHLYNWNLEFWYSEILKQWLNSVPVSFFYYEIHIKDRLCNFKWIRKVTISYYNVVLFLPLRSLVAFRGYCNLYFDMNHIYHVTKQHVIYNFLLWNEEGKHFPLSL